MNDQAFDWQLPGKIVVIDNNSELVNQKGFDVLMKTGAFAVVAFDPSCRVENPEHFDDNEDVQLFRHAVLGNGEAGTLYACLDAAMTSTLPPLPAEKLPVPKQQGSKVLARMPINTIALDAIEGLGGLDWLILADNSDSLAVLEHGERALAEALLLQARVVFQPTHAHQPDLMQLSHWAARHGFRFYRLNQLSHYSHLPNAPHILSQQATELEAANALFIPSHERLPQLSKAQLTKLGFLLHTVYGAYDLTYEVLQHLDADYAERYLLAEGLSIEAASQSGVVTASEIQDSANTTGDFSAAQQQWLENTEQPDEELLDALTKEEEATPEDDDTLPQLSGDLEADLEALRERYPLAGSPLREMTYLIELLDTLAKDDRFEEGYRLLFQAIEDGLVVPDQLEILLYWRKKQLTAQDGHWLPETIREPGIPWYEQGKEAAKAGNDVAAAVYLRRQGAIDQAQAWLEGYTSENVASPLAQAEMAALKIIRREPIQVEALLDILRQHEDDPVVARYLALWLLNAQKASKALAVANRLDPGDPEVRLIKARILIKQERMDLAKDQLAEIPWTAPCAAEAFEQKARIQREDKALGPAVEASIKSLCHTVTYLPAWETLGQQAFVAKSLSASLADMLETIMRASAGSQAILQLLVSLYMRNEVWEGVIRWGEEGIQRDPKSIPMRLNLIQAYHKQKEWAAVRLHAQAGIELHSNKVAFSYYLGVAENELSNFNKALTYLEACYRVSPNESRICFEYARSLVETRQHKKAMGIIKGINEKALNTASLSIMANIHIRLGNYEKSIDIYQQLLEKDPENAHLHWGLSNALLKAGRFGQGWDEYEWGFEANQRTPNRQFKVPQWEGQPLAENQKLLVWYEQGLGDEIMFAACLTQLDKPGCNIILQCRERLETLFRRTFAHIEIWPVKEDLTNLKAIKVNNIAYHLPVGSLMRILHRDPESIVDYSGYLKCDEKRASYWRKFLEDRYGKDKKFVGVSWSGGLTTLKKARTFFGTRKESFKPIFEVKGVVFISLMYFDVSKDISELNEAGVSILQLSNVDMKNDLEEVSAITKALDLVISTETFPAMHAPTLGTESWVLTNASAHFYMNSESFLTWFESKKIFQIQNSGSIKHIDNMAKKVAAKLEALVGNNYVH